MPSKAEAARFRSVVVKWIYLLLWTILAQFSAQYRVIFAFMFLSFSSYSVVVAVDVS